MKTKLTQSLVERAPAPPRGKTVLYSDPEIRGFYLVVGHARRSWYVQSLVRGRQVRTKIGDAAVMSARDARDIARKTLVEMRQGLNPNQERRAAMARGQTLRDALAEHLASRSLSPRTREDYEYLTSQYLPDWLDKPLAEIGADRKSVKDRHARITAKHGASTADHTMRVFRAVYSRARRAAPELMPESPCGAVDFGPTRKRKVDAPADGLLAWGRAAAGLQPVRRDLHLFMLLTGMRRTAACESRLEHLDLDGGRLHVPKPKGGASRAFDLPLSPQLVDLLRHRRDENARLHRRSPWLFPADSRSGHVSEVAQAELQWTGHRLRHLYASLSLQAGVPFLETKRLLNHSSGDVTSAYIHLSLPHLRACQSLASAYILKSVGLAWTDGAWPPAPDRCEVNSAEVSSNTGAVAA